tara:strand:+ start:95 stop:898 length:804 start_codon:yes stop_codon:yes gene_type:complete
MRLIDLCAILTVVGFSFIFTLKETKYVNNQLLFIVSSLIVILFYKLMNYNKIEKELNQLTQQKNNNQVNNQVIEQFNNSVEGQVNGLITKILTFIEGTDQGTISEPIQRSEEIVDLSKNVEDLKQLLTILASDKNISTSRGQTTENDPNATLNLISEQHIQDRELDALESELQELKTKYQTYDNERVEKKYNKIPVYSSCVISDANGDVSVDTPSSNNNVSSSDSNRLVSGQPSLSIPSSSNRSNLRTSGSDIISQIFKRGVTLNIQ